jgi:hypothetical protein
MQVKYFLHLIAQFFRQNESEIVVCKLKIFFAMPTTAALAHKNSPVVGYRATPG